MSLADYEAARELVVQAEEALGSRFPHSYRSFVGELGAGDIAGEEFYGVIDDNFDSSGVPTPGASEPGDDLETVPSDFGELFRTRIEAGLSRRGVLS